MLSNRFVSGSSLAAFALSGLLLSPALVAGELPPPGIPGAPSAPVKGASTLRKAYADFLLSKEKSGDPAALLKDPAYRKALAAHEVLRVTGDRAIDALSDARPDFKAFLAAFLDDTGWMESYLATGRVPKETDAGLAVLAKIWATEGRSPDFARYHSLDTAIAGIFGSGRQGEALRAAGNFPGIRNIDPLWRYRFFRDRNKAGRLHPMFATLKSWELGYVVGMAWDDASYAWLNDHINVPLARYTDVCWVPVYRGGSDFGDHIQGPLFYRPWSDRMPVAESVKLHGGVCGSLSTFGATAAAAHGIPAYTAGQPGHCAYAVRFARGDWRGGFGGPDGSPHNPIWEGNLHMVNLAEAVFGDDAGLNLALAHLARARLYADAGDVAKAGAAYVEALKASPLHPDIHREYIVFLGDRSTPAEWRAYAERILADMAPYGAATRDVLGRVEAKFVPALDDAGKLAWFAKVNAAFGRATESWAWNYGEDVLDRQAAYFGAKAPSKRKGAPKSSGDLDEADVGRLFRDALAGQLASEKKPYFGKVIDWGVTRLLEAGHADLFGTAFAEGVAGPGAGKADPKLMKDAYSKAIVGAEKAKSLAAFQALSKAASTYASKQPAEKLDKPAGRLVSDKGYIRASTYAWDDPLTHLNVLNETGGRIHTEKEAAPNLIVELPETTAVSGLLIVKNQGNEWRMKKMKVYSSTDGATWFPVAETPDMPSQWKIVCPPETKARWIKVESLPEAPEHLHLRNILIFAKE